MFEEIKNKWDKILENTIVDYNISRVSYNTFLIPLFPYLYEKRNGKNDLLHITINKDIYEKENKNLDCKIFINLINKRYSQQLQLSLNNFYPNVDIVIEDKMVNISPLVNVKYEQIQEKIQNAHLNENYTFDNFIQGNSNNMAYSAALAVATQPGVMYNPLFIYGNSGLGKTHLLHSIGNFVLNKYPEKKILYVTTENFTNEMIEAIKNKTTSIFRKKYRETDLLLLDDIQFISGIDSVQDEVFSTFNDMYQKGKCIVFSSDQPPKNIKSIDERIKTRLSSGLPVDIQKPEYATRMAILMKKQEKSGVNLDNEILKYIANNVTDNVRELEGSLNKIILLTKINGEEVTLQTAKDALIDIVVNKEENKIDINYIIKIVAEHFNLKIEDILGKKRNSNIVIPRHIAMYVCKELTDLSLKNIGESFGGRDHSTVINAINNINNEVTNNKQISEDLDIIIKKISPQKK